MAVYNLSHYPCSFYRASRVEQHELVGRVIGHASPPVLDAAALLER